MYAAVFLHNEVVWSCGDKMGRGRGGYTVFKSWFGQKPPHFSPSLFLPHSFCIPLSSLTSPFPPPFPHFLSPSPPPPLPTPVPHPSLTVMSYANLLKFQHFEHFHEEQNVLSGLAILTLRPFLAGTRASRTNSPARKGLIYVFFFSSSSHLPLSNRSCGQ